MSRYGDDEPDNRWKDWGAKYWQNQNNKPNRSINGEEQ